MTESTCRLEFRLFEAASMLGFRKSEMPPPPEKLSFLGGMYSSSSDLLDRFEEGSNGNF